MYICNEFFDRVFYLYPGLCLLKYWHIGAKAILVENSCLHTVAFSRDISTTFITDWMFHKYLVKVLMDEINIAPLENTSPHGDQLWPQIKNNLHILVIFSFYPILSPYCKQLKPCFHEFWDFFRILQRIFVLSKHIVKNSDVFYGRPPRGRLWTFSELLALCEALHFFKETLSTLILFYWP